MTGAVAQQVIGLAIFLLLARLLTPDVFGSVALALIWVELALLVGRWGTVELIQQQSWKEADYRAVFQLILLGNLLLSLLLVCIAWPMSWIFSQPSVAIFIYALAPLPLLQCISVIPEGKLRKKMQFAPIAMRGTVSYVAGGMVSIWMAYGGYGAWALVGQKILGVILPAFWLFSLSPVNPIGVKTPNMLPVLWRQGGQIVSNNIANALNGRIVEAAVGFWLGVQALGYVKITWRIFDMLVSLLLLPFSSAALPWLMAAEHPQQLRDKIAQISQITSLLVIPGFVGMALIAPYVIPLLLGEQWRPAVMPLQLLMLAGTMASINTYQVPVLLATHQTRWVSRLSLLNIFANVIFVVALTPLGLGWAILAFLLRASVMTIAFISVCQIVLNWHWRLMFKGVFPAIMGSIFMSMAVVASSLWLDSLAPLGQIVYIMLVCVIIYWLTIRFIFDVRFSLKDINTLRRQRVKDKR